MADDPINPPHYRAHPSGVECITVTEHMNFNLGNAMKYIWRADEKGNPIENLRKAAWYLEREISRRGAAAGSEATARQPDREQASRARPTEDAGQRMTSEPDQAA